MTPTNGTRDDDDFSRALQAAHGRLRRHAVLRLALYGWFTAATLAGAAVVAVAIARVGSPGLVGMWPALASAALAIGVALWLLVGQAHQVRTLRQRVLPVQVALQMQLAVARRARRHSAVLLGLATLSLPALLLAIRALSERAALAPGQPTWLVLACLLPVAIIGIVHGSRYARLGQAQRRLQVLLEQLH